MRREVRLFTLQLDRRTGTFDDGPVREWLALRELSRLDSAFFVHEGLPTWTILAEARPVGSASVPPGPAAPPERPSRARAADAAASTAHRAADAAASTAHRAAVDALDDLESARFERLLVLRRDLSRREGVPPYIIYSNAIALDLARRAPTTVSGLSEIRGLGRKRVEQHARFILEALHGAESPRRSAETPPVRGVDGDDAVDLFAHAALPDPPPRDPHPTD